MGAGRKTHTVTYDSRNEGSGSQSGGDYRREIPPPPRNLGEKLAGVIFGCTKDTYKGLPANHWQYVQFIDPNMPVFLFNYTDKLLHGIFIAAGHGEQNINDRGWVGSHEPAHHKTKFPAQVRVKWLKEFPPAKMAEWKPVLADNFYSDNHFHFELEGHQATALVEMFKKKGGGRNPAPARPPPTQLAPSPPPAVNPWRPGASAAPATPPRPAPATPNTNGALGKDNTGELTRDPQKTTAPPPYQPAGNQAAATMDAPAPKAYTPVASSASSAASSPGRAPAPYAPPDTKTQAPPPYKPSEAPPKYNPCDSGLDNEGPAPPPAPTTASKATLGPPPAYLPQSAAKVNAGPLGWNDVAPAPAPTSEAALGPPPAYLPQSAAVANAGPLGWDAPGVAPAPPATKEPTPAAPPAYVPQAAPAAPSATMAAPPTDITSLTSSFAEMQATIAYMAAHMSTVLQENANLQQRVQVLEQQNVQLRSAHGTLHASLNEMRQELTAAGRPLLHGASDTLASDTEMTMAQPATPQRAPAIPDINAPLYICGGMATDRSFLPTLSQFCPGRPELPVQELAPCPTARAYGSLVGIGTRLVLVGGGTRSGNTPVVNVYDTAADAWSEAASLPVPRQTPACRTLGGKVYAVGGGSVESFHNNVDIYHPEVNRWLTGPPLRSKRFALSLAALDNVLYALGGIYQKEYLDVVERYDPRMSGWETMRGMGSKRGAPGCCVVDGQIYIVGGSDGSDMLSTCEVYEPRTNSWRTVGSMKSNRVFHASCLLGGELYTYGGMMRSADRSAPPPSPLEKYSPAADVWQAVPAHESLVSLARDTKFSAACSLE